MGFSINRKPMLGKFAQERKAAVLSCALILVPALPSAAGATGVPASIVASPSLVEQGEETTTPVIIRVTLAAPSPCFFICQVRSSDSGALTCRNIVFRKGDLMATSTATVNWGEVTGSGPVELTAYSIDAPLVDVTTKIRLETKDDASQ